MRGKAGFWKGKRGSCSPTTTVARTNARTLHWERERERERGGRRQCGYIELRATRNRGHWTPPPFRPGDCRVVDDLRGAPGSSTPTPTPTPTRRVRHARRSASVRLLRSNQAWLSSQSPTRSTSSAFLPETDSPFDFRNSCKQRHAASARAAQSDGRPKAGEGRRKRTSGDVAIGVALTSPHRRRTSLRRPRS